MIGKCYFNEMVTIITDMLKDTLEINLDVSLCIYLYK